MAQFTNLRRTLRTSSTASAEFLDDRRIDKILGLGAFASMMKIWKY
jgi:hypothetical protein